MESIKWNESENPTVSDNLQNCEYDKYNKKIDVVKPPMAMKSYINIFGKGGGFLYIGRYFLFVCLKLCKKYKVCNYCICIMIDENSIYYDSNLKNENENWEYIVFHYLKSLMKKNDFAEMKKIIDFYKYDITFTRDKNYNLLWYASKKYNKEAFSFLVDNIINKKEGKNQIDSILDALYDFEDGGDNSHNDVISDNSVHDNYTYINTSNNHTSYNIEYHEIEQTECCNCGTTFE